VPVPAQIEFNFVTPLPSLERRWKVVYKLFGLRYEVDDFPTEEAVKLFIQKERLDVLCDSEPDYYSYTPTDQEGLPRPI
jgi:hypothetical protein